MNPLGPLSTAFILHPFVLHVACVCCTVVCVHSKGKIPEASGSSSDRRPLVRLEERSLSSMRLKPETVGGVFQSKESEDTRAVRTHPGSNPKG